MLETEAMLHTIQAITFTFLSVSILSAQNGVASAPDGVALTGEKILAKLASMEAERNMRLPSYKVMRVYNLQMEKRAKPVISKAEFKFNKEGGKAFRIVEEQGPDGFFRGALQKVMQAEVNAAKSKKEVREVEVSPENYTATLVGKEILDGRQCYVLSVVPRRNSKYLIKGKAWVDAEDFGLLRLEGSPTASLSFWVGKPYIVQTFENFGGHFLLMSTESEIDARIVGRLKLTISSAQYAWNSADSMKLAAGGN